MESNGRVAVVEALLARGAAVDQPATSDATLLVFAAQNDHIAVVETLLGQGADGPYEQCQRNPLYVATSSAHLATVEALLWQGEAVNQANEEGWFTLHTASSNGHFAVAETLLH